MDSSFSSISSNKKTNPEKKKDTTGLTPAEILNDSFEYELYENNEYNEYMKEFKKLKSAYLDRKNREIEENNL